MGSTESQFPLFTYTHQGLSIREVLCTGHFSGWVWVIATVQFQLSQSLIYFLVHYRVSSYSHSPQRLFWCRLEKDYPGINKTCGDGWDLINIDQCTLFYSWTKWVHIFLSICHHVRKAPPCWSCPDRDEELPFHLLFDFLSGRSSGNWFSFI